MSSGSNKSAFLGMPMGTANGRLRKLILFSLLEKHGENVCHACANKIDSPAELSIEHKLPWEGRSVELFWDLHNIAFSHLSCNRPHVRSGGQPVKHVPPDANSHWCSMCKSFKEREGFARDPGTKTGLAHKCKECFNKYRRHKRSSDPCSV